jgi:hypothetical protein
MKRAIVSRKTLDALIRAKLATLDGCTAVEALPVTWRNGNGHGANSGGNGHCNWEIPGWVGEAEVVKTCSAKLDHYLDFLREQFDIPAPSTVGGDD